MSNKIKLMRASTEPKEPVDILKKFIELSDKYRNIFIQEIEGEVFIYRALGRGEYKDILDDQRFSDLDKEEIICDQCMLYPSSDEYNWDDKPAGLATELLKCILTDSYLDSVERRRNLHEYYRAEMYDLENQITCIINEAFPDYDIEEIEKWDVEKTTKYLSRAEWKLQNMRGIQFREAEGEFGDYAHQDDEMGRQPEKQERVVPKKKDDGGKTIRGGERKDKLTPEKLREREEFFKKYPQFAAIASQGTIDDVAHMNEQPTEDNLAPALRVPGH